MNKRTVVAGVIGIGLVLLLAGCTATPNNMVGTPAADGSVAGFLQGFWHGFIMLVTLILSLFVPGVSVYEIHNDGLPYNIGFVVGAAVFFGGGIGGTFRSHRRSR